MDYEARQGEAGAAPAAAARGARPKKLFYGYILIPVLGFMYFCSSGIVLPTATIVNPLMLQDASLGMNATMLGTGFSLFVLVQGLSAPLVGRSSRRRAPGSAWRSVQRSCCWPCSR